MSVFVIKFMNNQAVAVARPHPQAPPSTGVVMTIHAEAGIPDSKPNISPVWAQFAQRLSSVLQGLLEDQYLVISAKQSNLYIQFAGQGFYGLLMETISNQYLSETEQLDDSQIDMLVYLGWNKPTDDLEAEKNEQGPDGSPNFYINNPKPVSFDAVAELTVKTFSQVHKIPHPGYLEYDAFDSDDNIFTVPGLGLKQATKHPSNHKKMRQDLLRTIRGFTGISDLKYDQNGNIGIRSGSVVTFIRYKEKPPSIRFHSPLVSEVKEGPELFARLNELNSRIGCMHFFHRNYTIVAISDIPAAPFNARHVLQSLKTFSSIADGLDEVLAVEFGGKTAFGKPVSTIIKQ